ncbi:hypothetical protein NM688_g5986 [Phlebia brevispora]|uniref:Uncharacterized protein n=1 Tax=Phlebia brevispora TaxID=194682 RepID=A0ACC1SLK6_9APHY|nr:hypothetical protein NM688_g5986 [Phlebia brevispora]
MLLKFTTADIFNSTIVDQTTGDVVFRVATPGLQARSRSRSASSLFSTLSSETSASGSTPLERVTTLFGADDTALAEITWVGEAVTHIRIGEEGLDGNHQLFAADFVKILADETLVPTRMEYVWRIMSDSLELLDDDSDTVGVEHSDSVCLDEQLLPARRKGTGRTFLEFTGRIPSDELPEVILTYLLITNLRERIYWVARYVCGKNGALHSKNPLNRLRRQATRSFANLRDTILRRT